ncbi:hypothetical protein M0805_005365 [Coniferiporia weirii]|nr:hypothetical protein M0805_005365 [Coniferiporia weirii]
MSKPDIVPVKTVSGIAVDPRTLERVIPESKRPDGSVRKQIKIRPGFTPQEDVSRFRGSLQKQLDRNALPKGHILGWVAPSSEKKGSPSPAGESKGDKPLSKSALKNAKRKAKKQAENEKVIQANWEVSDEEPVTDERKGAASSGVESPASSEALSAKDTQDGESKAAGKQAVEALAEEVGKLDVR